MLNVKWQMANESKMTNWGFEIPLDFVI